MSSYIVKKYEALKKEEEDNMHKIIIEEDKKKFILKQLFIS